MVEWFVSMAMIRMTKQINATEAIVNNDCLLLLQGITWPYMYSKAVINDTFNFTSATDELTSKNCMRGIEIVDNKHAIRLRNIAYLAKA